MKKMSMIECKVCGFKELKIWTEDVNVVFNCAFCGSDLDNVKIKTMVNSYDWNQLKKLFLDVV